MPFPKNKLEKFEQWPYINQDSSEIIREERVNNTFYPKVSPGIISRLNFLEGIAKPDEAISLETNMSDPKFLEVWNKLSDQMAIAESQCCRVEPPGVKNIYLFIYLKCGRPPI